MQTDLAHSGLLEVAGQHGWEALGHAEDVFVNHPFEATHDNLKVRWVEQVGSEADKQLAESPTVVQK